MVTQHVVPIIQGDIGDYNCMGIEKLFDNLDYLTDGSTGNANPHYYYGARLQQLDERVFTELGGIIIPSTQLDQPILPNFFLEVKGPDGSLGVAKRQACYDGALGARGMQHLLSYGSSDLVYDNKDYTLTSLTAYRNGRDWAERQRNEAIEQANMRAQVALIGVGIGVGASAHSGKTYGRALEVASREGYKEVVKMLLDKGADVNAQGGDYGRALQAASGGGHKEIVEMLLDKGADVNAQGGLYGTALQAASGEGYKEIVKMLLDKGADVNAQGGYYGTALWRPRKEATKRSSG
ncbi:hypothetical protein N0V85_009450 [Neurospora sp. IMI 360204]|nr:hypothetical protein N0V85_009450 [Neurospora sp. IMI 360204]